MHQYYCVNSSSSLHAAVCERFAIDAGLIPSLNIERKMLGKIRVGEWDKYVGRDFSSGVEYRCSFALGDVDKNILLDLGEVFCCCRISVNGKFLTALLAQPYTVEIPRKFLCIGKNDLTVTVYNTAANAYLSHDYDDIPEAVKGTYHDRTLEFEKMSLRGGLLAPIKIYKLI